MIRTDKYINKQKINKDSFIGKKKCVLNRFTHSPIATSLPTFTSTYTLDIYIFCKTNKPRERQKLHVFQNSKEILNLSFSSLHSRLRFYKRCFFLLQTIHPIPFDDELPTPLQIIVILGQEVSGKKKPLRNIIKCLKEKTVKIKLHT